MSKVQQIVCDALKCNQVKGVTNHWWILRFSNDGGFYPYPMQGTPALDNDQHLCSSPCLHAALEAWIESHQAKPEVEFTVLYPPS